MYTSKDYLWFHYIMKIRALRSVMVTGLDLSSILTENSKPFFFCTELN